MSTSEQNTYQQKQVKYSEDTDNSKKEGNITLKRQHHQMPQTVKGKKH